jgi:hypothetical protein
MEGLAFLWKWCFYYSMSSFLWWCYGLTTWGLRWLLFSNSFTFSMLSCGFTFTDEFVLR